MEAFALAMLLHVADAFPTVKDDLTIPPAGNCGDQQSLAEARSQAEALGLHVDAVELTDEQAIRVARIVNPLLPPWIGEVSWLLAGTGGDIPPGFVRMGMYDKDGCPLGGATVRLVQREKVKDTSI